MAINEKLSKIQSELFVPKNNKNDFGKYNYRSCEDILKKVKPLCEKYGCVLRLTNEITNVGDRYYVNAIVVLTELETGEDITSMAQAREAENKKGMDESQISGTASSYARKYALAGLFCIDNEKDADTNEYRQKQEEQEESMPEGVTADQKKEINKLNEDEACASRGKEWTDKTGIKSLSKMTSKDAEELIKYMKGES